MSRHKHQFELEKEQASQLSKNDVLDLVSRALDQIQYGEIVIKIQAGKPVWVDKYERERVG